MEKVFFSIIVPCYNVSQYVEECLNSIISQNYSNYEVIVINDGSTDNTLEVINNYSKYNNIKIIDQKNTGLSGARNTGISASNGEYILFMDSDDYWDDDNFLNELEKHILKFKDDVIVYGYKKYFESKNLYIPKELIESNSENIIEYLIKTNYFKACAWDKAVKSSIVKENNLLFPLNRFSEDIIWCSNLLNFSRKIGYLNINPYIYRQRSNSISKSIKIKNIDDVFFSIKTCVCNDNLINSFLAYEYSVLLGLISMKKIRNIIDKKILKEIYSYSYLLNYNLSYKVKKVYILKKMCGIKLCSKILGLFIDLKSEV